MGKMMQDGEDAAGTFREWRYRDRKRGGGGDRLLRERRRKYRLSVAELAKQHFLSS
jgi:hypothetical protein